MAVLILLNTAAPLCENISLPNNAPEVSTNLAKV